MKTNDDTIIKMKNVFVSYGKNRILNSIDYDFKKGCVYLLLGENGTGKTTLLNTIMGLTKVELGKVIISNKTLIGYVPEKMIFPDYVSVYDFLYNLGLIKKIKKNHLTRLIDLLLEQYQLSEKRNCQIQKLSKGMQQKVLIIQALLNNPDIYIFDEVLNGLDKEMQKVLFSFIKMMKLAKKTIIITTHYQALYKNVYDYKIILENGTIRNDISY